jgi:stage II sporulation protein D
MLRTLRRFPLHAVLLAAFALVAISGAGTADAAQRLTIRGAGFGHGVGLSQYGAQGYALQGAGYRTILAHYYKGTKIGRAPRTAGVRVLLKTGSSVSFRGATRAGRRALNAATTYRARLTGSGSGSGATVTLTGGGRSVRVAQRARISGPGPLSIGGLGRYRGALELSDDGSSALQVVNAIGVEDYVRGVIAREMYATWEPEALKAQAVAARTYALTIKKSGNGFDQYADTRSQMYRGVTWETAATDAAVAATRLQVVTYRGRAVPTYFHASSGGRTENVEVGFDGAQPQPWLVGVADPYDVWSGNPYRSWTKTFPIADAQARLGTRLKGSLQAIRVLRRGASGRVVTAEVVGSEGTTTVSGNDLAYAFGLFSSWATYAVA